MPMMPSLWLCAGAFVFFATVCPCLAAGGQTISEVASPRTPLAVHLPAGALQQLAFELKATAGQPSILLKEGDTEQITAKLPGSLQVNDLEEGLRNALWNEDSTAAIIVIKHHEGTLILAFVEYHHQWSVYDISAVERQNCGKLGMKRSELRSIATRVIQWAPQSNGQLRAILKTRVTNHEGKTFSAQERLTIDRATGPLYR